MVKPKTVKSKQDLCRICGSNAKGTNFKVASCRACAEFFRRSILANKKYKCIKNTRECNLSEKNYGKRLCRYCRLQKCKKIGMSIDRYDSNLHENLENINSVMVVDKDTPPKSSSTESNEKYKKPFIDMKPIENAIKSIFSQTHATPITPRIKLSCLQQLDYGFSLFLDEIKPKSSVTKIDEFDAYMIVKHQEKFLIAFAKMLTYCEKFVELEYEDKMKIFKNSWRLIYELERHYSSIQYFGTTPGDFRMLFDDKTFLDYNSANVRIKGIDEKARQDILKSWGNFYEHHVKTIINPMKNLQLIRYEITYLVAQIFWSLQNLSEVSKTAQKTSDAILEQISDELHVFYTHEMRMTNYASRLTKLTKLIDAFKELLELRKKHFIMYRVFHLMDVDFVNSELYEWCK